MVAGKYNFTLQQGETFYRKLALTNNGIAVDLTDYTAKMHIRVDYGETLLIELSTENGGITIPAPVSGEIFLHMTNEETSLLTFDEAKYDLELYHSTSVLRLIQGNITMSYEVTVQ